jgi:FMN-dependent NADH-azoreductase
MKTVLIMCKMSGTSHNSNYPSGDHSTSRTLSKELISDWKTAHPNDTYREL